MQSRKQATTALVKFRHHPIDQVGNGVTDSQNSGNLPAGARVTVIDEPASGSDEGRAMAELIYDVVDVDILFHSAAQGATDFANGIHELGDAGAEVVTDEFSYYSQPVFQNGVIAEAVDFETAFHGFFMFGSAGNRNNESLYDQWLDGDADNLHNFFGGDETIDVTLANGEQLRPVLHRNQPWGGATTDIDIEIWNASLTTKLADSNTNNIGGNPMDSLTFTNTTGGTADFHVSFRRVSGSANGLQLYMVSRNNDDDFTDPYVLNQRAGIAGNHAADSIFAMGAVPWNTPNTIESFSSRGPNTIYFTPGGAPTGPFTRQKPDFTAADGTSTSVPGFGSFFGTSAASPNAAAVAVQVLDAADGTITTYAQLSDIFADTAIGAGVGSWDGTHGEGRINALGAGLVANGMLSDEFTIELNPFGDASFDQNLSGNTDLDRFIFATDNSGATTIDIVESDVTFDPGAILWNAETSDFVAIDYNGGPGDDARISESLSFWTLHQIQVFSESDISGASNFTVQIDAPNQTITAVSLNADGDGSISGVVSSEDADYFSFVAPSNAISLDLSADNLAASLDAVLTLYDSAGDQLLRADSAFGGGAEAISFNGVVPGATYYARVGAFNYAKTGSFDLDVDFNIPVSLTGARLQVDGTPQADKIEFLAAGGSNVEVVFDGASLGSYGPVTLIVVFGDAGDDVIDVQDSLGIASKLVGDAGDDTLDGGAAADVLVGGPGNDFLRGRGGNDVLKGNAGVDTLLGDEGNDQLLGNFGPDKLDGGSGNDDLRGNAGDDILRGGSGSDTLNGDAGRDVVLGEEGADTVRGGGGRDLLIGGLAADDLFGGDADDILIGGSTVHDGNDAALQSILNEWKSASSYPDRVNHIRGTLGGGLNAPFFLSMGGGDVLNDGAVDDVAGEGGRDWFFQQGDSLADKSANEFVD